MSSFKLNFDPMHIVESTGQAIEDAGREIKNIPTSMTVGVPDLSFNASGNVHGSASIGGCGSAGFSAQGGFSFNVAQDFSRGLQDFERFLSGDVMGAVGDLAAMVGIRLDVGGAGGAGGAGYASGAQGAGGYDTQAGDGQMDYARAVATLDDNFDTMDTACGVGDRDGKFNWMDMQAALDNPGVPENAKAAIRFLLDNRAYMNQLDRGADGTGDGAFSKADLSAERAKHPVSVPPPPVSVPTYQAPSNSGSTGASGSSQTSGAQSSSSAASSPGNSDINAIINDPNMSMDQKVAMILAQIENDMDKDIEDDMKHLKNAKGDVDPTYQQKLQLAVAAKNEMASLATNFAKGEHDTRSQIIGNIR